MCCFKTVTQRKKPRLAAHGTATRRRCLNGSALSAKATGGQGTCKWKSHTGYHRMLQNDIGQVQSGICRYGHVSQVLLAVSLDLWYHRSSSSTHLFQLSSQELNDRTQTVQTHFVRAKTVLPPSDILQYIACHCIGYLRITQALGNAEHKWGAPWKPTPASKSGCLPRSRNKHGFQWFPYILRT